MKISKALIVLMILSILGTAYIYNQLPNEIPTHFNFNGEVDDYSHKSAAFVTAVLPLLLYIMMIYLPKIDPRKHSYLKHKKAYYIFRIIIILFLIIIHWATMSTALGHEINVGLIVKLGIGLLFIIIGNYMPQIRQNYFFGIKTPWTLANDLVWKKTHRLGGITFIIAGVLMVIAAFFKGMVVGVLSIGSLIIATAVPLIYSYIEYKKISN